jgi:Flp pilus assembly pilin Flp
MNKLAKVSKIRQLAKDSKGATLVEYALMLFLILLVAYIAVGRLGKSANDAISNSNTALGG